LKLEPYDLIKYARTINSRTDRFKVWAGPLAKAIEERVFALPYFIKHVPVVDRPTVINALKKAGLIYAEWDFSSFEKHFRKKIMEAIEFELYRFMLPAVSDDDISFLTGVLGGKNVLNFQLGRATILARRLSGEMFTSLGNGFTNLMLVLFLAEQKGIHANGVVEGDDGLFALDGRLTSEDWARLGFTVKEIHYYDDPGKAHFCGMIFSESMEIIRDPVRFFQKFGWTHSNIHAGPKIMNRLLRAKALSVLYETPQCPIIGAAAWRVLKITRGYEPLFVSDGYHDTSKIPRDEKFLPAFAPQMDTRNLFRDKFGVDERAQRWAEQEIAKGNFNAVDEALCVGEAAFADNIKYIAGYIGP
jgi:hypothetical protein